MYQANDRDPSRRCQQNDATNARQYAPRHRTHAFMPAILPPLAPANPTGFKLIHADRSLLVVSKPHRLLSVPGRGEDKQDCLIGRVQSEFPDALIVHRLDFDTSGLLVLARGKDMHRRLSILFQERAVDKRYVALVNGRLLPESGEVDLPLIVDWPNRPLHKVDFEIGKPSLTRYRALSYDEAQDRPASSLSRKPGAPTSCACICNHLATRSSRPALRLPCLKNQGRPPAAARRTSGVRPSDYRQATALRVSSGFLSIWPKGAWILTYSHAHRRNTRPYWLTRRRDHPAEMHRLTASR